MVKSFHNPENAPAPVGAYSQIARIDLGNALMIITAGQVALDAEGNIVGKGNLAEQAERIYQILQALLESQGGSLRDIVKMNTYVTSVVDRAAFAEVRAKYMGDHRPASTFVEVSKLAHADWLIEIEVTAVISK